MKIGVITISDTRSFEDDLSGPAVVNALRETGYTNFATAIVADDVGQIRQAIRHFAEECNAIFTTGGTGFSPRDVTPEATVALLDRRADSLCELMRLKGLDHTPYSHMSRGVAGTIGNTLVVNLPGSPSGATQGIEALSAVLVPILSNLAGDGCPVGPDGADC